MYHIFIEFSDKNLVALSLFMKIFWKNLVALSRFLIACRFPHIWGVTFKLSEKNLIWVTRGNSGKFRQKNLAVCEKHADHAKILQNSGRCAISCRLKVCKNLPLKSPCFPHFVRPCYLKIYLTIEQGIFNDRAGNIFEKLFLLQILRRGLLFIFYY